MGRLQGKVAIITGGSSGLGRVGAELFAREGAQIVIADVVDGDEVVDAIDAAGGEATFVRCDVSDEGSVEAAVQHAVDTFGGLHILYNNAVCRDLPTHHGHQCFGHTARMSLRHSCNVGKWWWIDRECGEFRGSHGRGDSASGIHRL
ncbi:MAG: hypothetical protein RL688_1826 [Actinomycetota bacterium]